MDAGTIVFHNDYHVFEDILMGLGVSEKSLCFSDSEFLSIHNHSRQALFYKLFNANHLWSYVCKKVKKRDGSLAYKILNANNKVNTMDANDIYFAVKMDDWSFSHWTEMDSIKNLSISKGGQWIMKKPSDSTKRTTDKIILNFGKMGRPTEMLFGIVSCKDGAKYPPSHPLNSEWDKYDPYYPKHGAFGGMFQNKTNSFFDKPYDYWGSKSTIHAVPFLRDNIKPTTFSVVIPTNSYEHRMCMFINFPNGLPFNFE
jgi:hypothetical protein